MAADRRVPLLAAAVAVLAGAVVFWLATDLFAFHSVNDDEGVYLTQAAMLLEGRLFLRPGALGELVRPWFFVVEETATGLRMYPKYAPVAAGVFAVGMALGDAHLSLAAVAAGNAALVYALAAAAFDRRTGVVAAAALVGSPLFLLSSSVFLSYAPTTLFELGFAVAYVRAARRGQRGYAALAGVAIGLAFFSRPYTAVLFAAPFMLHALAGLRRAHRTGSLRPALARHFATALPGLALVGTALWYNAAVTGDPLVFPYEAFAPRDGIGFGPHEILGYEETYTPALALESNATALWLFATRWGPAGPVGAALALLGAAWAVRDDGVPQVTTGVTPGELRVVLFGVAVSVALGNVYFWGTLNALRNDLLYLLGPFYHFDLLVPTSAFAATGAVRAARRVRAVVRTRVDRRTARVALAVAVVCATAVAAGAGAAALDRPYAENRERTANLAATYEPFREATLDDAVVFVPDSYGDWLHHPFQYLRNDPGFDGDALYVLDGGPDDDVRALDAAGARRPYRFTYRGEWTGATTPVESRLVPLRVHEGDAVHARTDLGAPAGATTASVRIETEGGHARYAADPEGGVAVAWTLAADGVRATNRRRTDGSGPVALPDGASEVDLVVTFVDSSGASVSYRQELTVERDGRTVRAVWPPETRVCRLTTECGHEGTYVGAGADYLSGVSVDTTAQTANASE